MKKTPREEETSLDAGASIGSYKGFDDDDYEANKDAKKKAANIASVLADPAETYRLLADMKDVALKYHEEVLAAASAASWTSSQQVVACFLDEIGVCLTEVGSHTTFQEA